jgi:hypothetical protein
LINPADAKISRNQQFGTGGPPMVVARRRQFSLNAPQVNVGAHHQPSGQGLGRSGFRSPRAAGIDRAGGGEDDRRPTDVGSTPASARADRQHSSSRSRPRPFLGRSRNQKRFSFSAGEIVACRVCRNRSATQLARSPLTRYGHPHSLRAVGRAMSDIGPADIICRRSTAGPVRLLP